jgi:hypothetical protein
MTDDDRVDALLRQMAAEEYNRPPQIVPREAMWDAVVQGLRTVTAGTGNGREPSEAGQMGTVIPFRRRVPKWVYFAIAAALLLAVGIQVGRLMGPARTQEARVAPDVRRDSLGPTRAAPDSISVAPQASALAQNDGRSDDGTGKGQPKPRPTGPERSVSPNPGDDVQARAYTVAAAQHLTEAEAMLTAFKGDLSQGRMDAEISAWGKDLLSNTRLLLDSPAANDPARRKLLQDLELVLVQIVQLSPKSSARDRDLIKGALTDDQVLTRLRTAIPVKGT